MPKTALILGAGPAGLTAAWELVERSDYHPLVLEKSTYMGGLSRTVNYKGNRIDIGGHRFFSKSDKVLEWWLKILPLESGTNEEVKISYQNKSRTFKNSNSADDTTSDNVMLVRERNSRIY